MPPRVSIVTSSHPFADTRIFKKEGRSLVQAGFEVIELAPVAEKRQVVDGITVLGFGKIQSRWSRIANFISMLNRAISLKADIYHLHEPELLFLPPIIKSIMPRSLIIYDVHEIYDNAILSDEKTWIPKWLKPWLAGAVDAFEKRMSGFCDLVVAAAPDIEKRFRHHRTISIRNYAPTQIIDKALKKKVPRKPGKKGCKVVYTGSITRTRGLSEVLRALEMVDPKYDATLLATGIYQDAEYQRQIEAEPGYRRMKYLGYLPRYEDVAAKAVGADMAVICFHPDPNLDTAVERSNKLFEYMAMGLPLVVSNLPGWVKVVEAHKCGVVVNPLDPADIAKGITYLIEHPQERVAMGARGRQAVKKYYNWETEGKRLVEAYNKLLEVSS